MPTVSETIEGPDGTPLQHVDVTVRLIASTSAEAAGYVSATDTTVLGRWHDITGADGVASLTLTANSLLVPVGTVYEWTRKAPGRPPVTDYISVPNGAGPYVVEDLLTAAPTALGGTVGFAAEPVIYYDDVAGNWPLRVTVTSDTTRPVLWSGPSSDPPPIGGGYAVDDLDFWRRKT